MPSLTNIIPRRLLINPSTGEPQWADSLSGAYFDGNIHFVGRAVNALGGSKLHEIFNTSGHSVATIVAPFTATNEVNLSLVKPGKLVAFGGTTSFEIWEFDPTVAGNTAGSWSLITADYYNRGSPPMGQRKMAGHFDNGSTFYIFGGWGRDTMYKTTDFLNWTLVGTLPNEIKKISACAHFVHNGKGYAIGGSCNMATEDNTGFYNGEHFGHVYEFDFNTETWTKILTDATKFGTIWIDGISNGTTMYVSPGLKQSTGLNQGGLYYSNDNGATWSAISPLTDGLEYFGERHRAPMVAVGSDAYIGAGYGCNDLWRINP